MQCSSYLHGSNELDILPYLDKFVIIYLDDILVYSNNEHDHGTHVRKVLEILCRNKLYAKKSKCTFGVNETEYLGFILKGDGIAISPQRTSAIDSNTTPESKKVFNLS